MNRLKEPSSYAALSGVFAMLGIMVPSDLWQSVVMVCGGAAGAIGFFVVEKKGYSMRLLALRKKYEANIDIAKANLDVLLHSAVGIGEHSDLTAEMDKWIGEIASNQDKIDAIDELNETKDTPPEQGDLFRETSRW